MKGRRLQDKIILMAEELVHENYDLCFKFPVIERWNLSDQLRRAMLSVPTNLVEGFSRYSSKEKLQFCRIAYSSLAESRFLLQFAVRRKYISEQDTFKFRLKSEELSKLIFAMIKALR